jgi:hypothetical protein
MPFRSLSCSPRTARLAWTCLVRVLTALGVNGCTCSPAFPLGKAIPVGARQGTGKRGSSARWRRPRARICLRKGCKREYEPRRFNQRYCQDPECLWQLRRWQAALRQASHRQDANARARHAQAERERRQRAMSSSQIVEHSEVTPARGHAPETFFSCRYATGRAVTNTR